MPPWCNTTTNQSITPWSNRSDEGMTFFQVDSVRRTQVSVNGMVRANWFRLIFLAAIHPCGPRSIRVIAQEMTGFVYHMGMQKALPVSYSGNWPFHSANDFGSLTVNHQCSLHFHSCRRRPSCDLSSSRSSHLTQYENQAPLSPHSRI